MNLKECKDAVLKNMDIYSIAGKTVALSYNNQTDYILRMVEMINDAQMEIAKTVKKIPAEFIIDQSPAGDSWVEYEMPVDFYQPKGGGVPWSYAGVPVEGDDYRWIGRSKLLLRNHLKGKFLIEYYRYPVQITSVTPDITDLDNTPDTHQAIPYYVASRLLARDDPYASDNLYNIFETRLVRLSEGVQTEVSDVKDVYGIWG